MTDTKRGNGTGGKSNAPRAIIHKQILDCAAAQPDASIESIAAEVSGTTATMVERVLDEYGDPAEADESPQSEESGTAPTASDDARTVTDGGSTSTQIDPGEPGEPATETAVTAAADAESPDSSPRIDPSSLTEKQAETLRAIRTHPDATQAELADMLGVSSPTISQRVNSIEGFDWTDRGPIVAELIAEGALETTHDTTDSSESGADDTGESTNGDDATDADESTDVIDEGDAVTSGTGPQVDADESTAATAERIDSSDPETTDGDTTEAAPATTDADDGRIAVDRQELAALREQVDALTARVSELENGRRDTVTDGSGESPLSDPELAHKVVHACMNADRITEDEELRLLRAATGAGADADR